MPLRHSRQARAATSTKVNTTFVAKTVAVLTPAGDLRLGKSHGGRTGKPRRPVGTACVDGHTQARRKRPSARPGRAKAERIGITVNPPVISVTIARVAATVPLGEP